MSIGMHKDTSIKRRGSLQNRMVYESICRLNHPTADEIFRELSKDAKIGYGTIYRNIQILQEKGQIRAVEGEDGIKHFDSHTGQHYHLLCSFCKGVFDISLPYQEELDRELMQGSLYLIDGHDITFHGVCPDCQIGKVTAVGS
jgi:Fur family peroxide stress response transcriptional regulator